MCLVHSFRETTFNVACVTTALSTDSNPLQKSGKTARRHISVLTHCECNLLQYLFISWAVITLVVKLQQHVHCEITTLNRESRDRENSCVELVLTVIQQSPSYLLQVFFFFLTFHRVFISNPITKVEYVTLSVSVVWHVRVSAEVTCLSAYSSRRWI